MLDVKVNISKIVEKLDELQNNLIKLKTIELQREINDWQEESFNRNKPNLEIRSQSNAVIVSTRFWEKTPGRTKAGKPRQRVSLRRAVYKQRMLGQWRSTKASRLAKPIVRPEKVVELYARVIRLTADMFKWPR